MANYRTVANELCNRIKPVPYRYKDFFEEGKGSYRMKYLSRVEFA